MASKLTKLQSLASQASKYVAENAPAYYKQLLEKNKHYIQDPPSVETCTLLSKQLFYTRLASIPGRADTFWKEFDHVKGLLKRGKELTTDDYGMAALFAVESYVLFKAGEISGRGFTFPGYRV